MAQIAAAVNDHDAEALKALFSPRALEQATDLDGGLDYLLSLFPEGGLTWVRSTVDSSGETKHGRATELLTALYKVTGSGKDYWLLFKDFTVNDALDPKNVGIYSLGVTPWTADVDSGPAEVFFAWSGSIDYNTDGEYGYPGVYRPDDSVVVPGQLGDARMDEIADAVDGQDAAALAAMFSTRAVQAAPNLDAEVTQFLSVLADGPLQWERRAVNSIGDDAGTDSKLLIAYYKAPSGETDYWLFFADYVVDAADPENVGLYALGISPWFEPGEEDPDPAFGEWTNTWLKDGTGEAGIYIPAA